MSNTENVPDIPIIPAMTDTVNMSNLHKECIISPEPNFIQIHTMSCQHLVNEAVSGILPGGSFLTQLCETGISDAEAQYYIDQVMQHCNQQQSTPPSIQGDHHSPPGNVQPPEAPNPTDAVSSLAWAVL